MPEHWTELSAAKRQRKLCREQAEAIKNACRKDCGKDKVTECPKCYAKLMDRLRSRYSESEEREWFSQRRAFLHELDGLFQDAKDRRGSLKSIESRIESEKEAWYRWVLRRYPEFIAAVSDRGVNQEELRGMLDDPDRSRQELVNTMLEGIGKPPNWPLGVDEFAEKVEAATRDDAARLKKLYVSEFFTDALTGKALQSAESYLDEYSNSETMMLEDVMDKIALDFQRSRSSKPQRESHKRRLDELKRAKTAFEQNKLQAKSLKGAQAARPGPELYHLPPCLACGNPVLSSEVLSCTVCQALAQSGGEGQLTVYCSEACYARSHDGHVKSQHDCEAGEHCVQLHDPDVEMGDGTSRTVACNECLDRQEATLYCSDKCAAANIAKHRQKSHGAKTTANAAQALVRSLQPFVGSTLESKNPGLVMAQVDSN